MKRPMLAWTIAALLGTATVVLFLQATPEIRESLNPDATQATTENENTRSTSVQIYGTAWGLTLAEDGTGFYNDLAKLYLANVDASVRYDVRPYRRAKALFLRNSGSCLYPSNIDLLLDGAEISTADGFIDTTGILQVKVYVFSQPGTTPPAGIHDVDRQTVAYAMGSRIPYFLRGANADFIAVANESDKARMLLTSRVDLITAALPDAKFVFDALGEPLPPFNPAYTLNDTQVRITCHDTPRNRAFVDTFNSHAATLLAEGKTKALIEANGLDAALYLPQQAP